MNCCGKPIVVLSGCHAHDDSWGFNVGACQTCGNVFRIGGWPSKTVVALTMDDKVFVPPPPPPPPEKKGPIVTVPSGLEVEMLHESDYIHKYQRSAVARPTPNNIGGWAMFVLKDRSAFEKLTEEDKEFLSDQQYEVYKVWGNVIP